MKSIFKLLLFFSFFFGYSQTENSKIIQLLEKSLVRQNLYKINSEDLDKEFLNFIVVNDSIKVLKNDSFLVYNKFKPDSIFFTLKNGSLINCSFVFTFKNQEGNNLENVLSKNIGDRGVRMNSKLTKYSWEDNFSELYLLNENKAPLKYYLNFRFKEVVNTEIVEDIKGFNYRKGIGNGSFKPDISYTLNLLQQNITKKQIENYLPEFKVIDDFSKSYSYNENTNEHDILDEEISRYSFMFNQSYMVYMKISINKGVVKKIEYEFDINQNIENLKNQILRNSFNFNSDLTLKISKMGFNDCFVFTRNPNYNFTIYSRKRYSLSK